MASHLKQLESLTLRVSKQPDDDWVSLLKELPPNLTTLLLHRLDDEFPFEPSKITNDAFSNAPQSLRLLSIPASPLLDAGCMQYLPNLAELMLEDNLGIETPKWFSQVRRMRSAQKRPRRI
jgi:hypothetical protein